MGRVKDAILEIWTCVPYQHLESVIVDSFSDDGIYVRIAKTVADNHQPDIAGREHLFEDICVPREHRQGRDLCRLLGPHHHEISSVTRSFWIVQEQAMNARSARCKPQ